MQTIDIVIPVFNNCILTRNCIDSVLRNTQGNYQIVIVDDNSTDAAVLALEQEYADKFANVVLLKTVKNGGFLPAANLGLKYSNNDVLLLNNDTVVTPNWLAKMYQAAYSAANIASVSAMSNNSTITSMPNYFKPNNIPKFFTLDQMATFVEKHSLKLYPQLPTAMGFCMYIKRQALEEVGYYDEIYGRGYCEENDWSLRARAKGWVHIMDDATYIWHKGRGTAGNKQRDTLVKQNEKILLERYPDYMQQIKRYITTKTNHNINRNLQYNLLKYRLKQLLGRAKP